ncbi:hypothetical protein NN561_006311 [Cricetulus griseus]
MTALEAWPAGPLSLTRCFHVRYTANTCAWVSFVSRAQRVPQFAGQRVTRHSSREKVQSAKADCADAAFLALAGTAARAAGWSAPGRHRGLGCAGPAPEAAPLPEFLLTQPAAGRAPSFCETLAPAVYPHLARCAKSSAFPLYRCRPGRPLRKWPSPARAGQAGACSARRSRTADPENPQLGRPKGPPCGRGQGRGQGGLLEADTAYGGTGVLEKWAGPVADTLVPEAQRLAGSLYVSPTRLCSNWVRATCKVP